MAKIKSYLELFKIPISLFAACSAGTGFILSLGVSLGILSPLVGTFVLACGALGLNQYQDREFDSRMDRTKQRPIPSGSLKPLPALFVSLLLIAVGLFFLIYNIGWEALLLGAAGVSWYNGVYTLLKRKTAFAVIPGALVGAVPPAIGWVAGGGSVSSPRLLVLCAIFFLWQIPHFWLLILSYGHEYEKAGLPAITGVLSRRQIERITFIWVCATGVLTILLPLYGIGRSKPGVLLLLVLTVWLVAHGLRMVFKSETKPHLSLFRTINNYIFILMILLSLGTIL